MRLTEEVRRTAREIAAGRAVRSTVDESTPRRRPARGSAPSSTRPRTTSRAAEDDVATFLLTLDAINFGSGWLPDAPQAAAACPATSRSPRALADRFRAARALDRRRAARDAHRGDRRRARPGAATTSSWRCTPRRCASSARGSASAATLDGVRDGGRVGRAARGGRSPTGMAMFDDRGFYKRAQIVAVRPRARRRRALPRPRPPDDLRRQPRPARPALRRRPRLRRRARAAHRRRAPAADGPAGARDPRLRGARLRAASPQRLGVSAAHARPLAVEPRAGAGVQGAPAPPLPHGLSTEPPHAGDGALAARRSGVTSAIGSRAVALQLGDPPLQLGDPRGHRLHRVGDRVGQVDPVGVGALGPAPSTRTGCPGLPTTVEFGGTSWMTTVLAPIFAP